MESGWIVFLTAITALQFSAVYNCENDKVLNINNIDLRSPESESDYWNDQADIVLNDVDLSPGWYRAVYGGWQYIMTDVSNKPHYFSCHTLWPIYLKENHTSLDNLGENSTTMTACVLDDSTTCSTNYAIEVRKCRDEIQYKLKPTVWLSAYCFEKHSIIPADVTPAPAPENVNLGNVVVKPELHFNKEPGIVFIWNVPYIIFRCTFDQSTDLFYIVDWYIDGTQFNETMGPSKDIESLTLHEDKLISQNINLGIYIRCGVSAATAYDGLRTPVTFSPRYYAGMKVLNTTVVLDKERSAEIEIETTVPIGCKYLVINDNKKIIEACLLDMKIFVPNSPMDCRRSSILNNKEPNDPGYEIEDNSCARRIKTLTADDEWDPKTRYKFTIVTSDHNYEDDSEFTLKLQFGDFQIDPIWKNYLFPDVKVFVKDLKRYTSKVCISRNDPHMTTGDGYSYEHHVKGVYMLYLHTELNIEVQQMNKKCDYGWAHAVCTCGVAVRAGKDVFMINRCGTVPFIGFTQCGDGGILDVVRIHDKKYRVFTPIGTRVLIRLFSSIWMDVEISMAPKDMDKVYGLCGRMDGDLSNDLTHRYSNIISPQGSNRWTNKHEKFAESWRIAEDSEENSFRSSLRDLTSWSQQNGLYCACDKDSNAALCSSSQFLNCTKPGSITQTKCHVQHRRKRSVGNNSEKEIRRLLSRMTSSISVSNNREKRQEENAEVIVREDAIDLCADKINGSQALSEFKDVGTVDDVDVVTLQCAFDISALNDTSWAESHLNAVNDGVKNMMDLQPTYITNNTDKVESFIKNSCPSNCSGNGVCSDSGTCACFKFYLGPDCSIDERDGLVILDIEGGGECDLAEGEECECFYVRSDRIQENFTCSINTSKILTNGDVVFISSSELKGGFEDIFTGICCAPLNIIGSTDVFVAEYMIAISNNGINFGNAERMYVFDSTCQGIKTDNNGRKTFMLKDQHCFIDGYCFSDNEMSMAGCLACQSAIAVYNWTEYNPCLNGGTCNDQTDGYSCSCIAGYGGIKCEYEINECLSNPCQNSGNCSDLFNGYLCDCLSGFTGNRCETNIDECLSNPCKHEALCIDEVNMYRCECPAGYDGLHCERDINECESNPCQNGGSCTDYVNGYTCTCAAGYYGTQCAVDINDCVSNPCLNGGTCVDKVNGRTCNCIPGYAGLNCELNIYECSSDPCLNGGSCEDHINGYSCNCVPGYTGSFCEQDINECSSNPCQNGGTCNDYVNKYICSCAAGYEGFVCDIEINECSSNPCQNGGTCEDKVGEYSCTCAAGYGGTICEIDIYECSSNPCEHGATCEDRVAGYSCICAAGYEGFLCEIDIDECLSDPCRNGGTCKDVVNGFSCNCAAGYEGSVCSHDIDECFSDPCKNFATCEDVVNGYTCKCAAGYEGTDCSTEINECSSNPCKNGGTCYDEVASYSCICPSGYEGLQCETDINECTSNPCKNGGTCKDEVAGYSCICSSGYNGKRCETDINECSSNPCQNGANCEDLVADFNCICADGYEGTLCETDINECSSDPCKNGGTCIDEVAGYSCICSSGYEDTRCETDINECSSNPCQNGANCEDLIADFNCICTDGFEGTLCETDINECSSNPCKNGGTCKDEVAGYSCICSSGYEDTRCETDINECSSSPCQNGANCEDLIADFNCICADGYEGTLCETDINECLSNPCLNGGSCEDKVNGYLCLCAAGFFGVKCGTDINDCKSNPCLNGGNCTDQVNGRFCTCPSGYSGLNCELDTDECLSNPCENGGTCSDHVNGYSCKCADGYSGVDCGVADTDECLSNPCKNGGTCSDHVNGYSCKCADGSAGVDCSVDIDECSSKPCQNGGSCDDQINGYTCKCAAGYEGINCQDEIDECSSDPCQNGGICEDHLNGYNCKCATRFEGTHCEDEAVTEKPSLRFVRTQVVLVFPVRQTGVDLTNSPVNKDLTIKLATFFKRKMGDMFKDITIRNISFGSLIVDFEVEFENHRTAIDDFTQANMDLVSGAEIFDILNQTVSAKSVKINGIMLTNETFENRDTLCELYVSLNSLCQDMNQCSLEKGRPICIPYETETKFKHTLTIVLVVCSVAALVLIVVIACLTIRKFRVTRKWTHSKPKNKSAGFEETGQWRKQHTIPPNDSISSGLSIELDSKFPESEQPSRKDDDHSHEIPAT